MKFNEFVFEGVKFNVVFSKHALNRSNERGVSTYQIHNLIQTLSDNILDLTISEMKCFSVKNGDTGDTAICRMSYLEDIFYIDIITVYNNIKNKMNRKEISQILEYKTA